VDWPASRTAVNESRRRQIVADDAISEREVTRRAAVRGLGSILSKEPAKTSRKTIRAALNVQDKKGPIKCVEATSSFC
jgi:hypothetical protein